MTQRLDVNGSTVIVVEAIETKSRDVVEETDPVPLVYHNRRWHVLSEKSALSDPIAPFYHVYGRDE